MKYGTWTMRRANGFSAGAYACDDDNGNIVRQIEIQDGFATRYRARKWADAERATMETIHHSAQLVSTNS